MATQEEQKVGLELMDDETLASIASQTDGGGEMTTEARIAFRELARRSGQLPQ